MVATEKEVLMQLIELYRDMPYLHNKSDKNYFNKSIRDEGFKELLEIYKKIDKNATLKALKKKIVNLKTNYFKELRKVKSSIECGAGIEDIYVPTLWYFEAFSFLESPPEPCRQPADTPLLDCDFSLSSNEEIKNDITAPRRLKKKKKNNLISKQESVMDKTIQILSSKEDDFEVLGKSIGIQLRDLNKSQLAISRKLISDVIYYGTLDKLNEDAHIVLGSTPFQLTNTHSPDSKF